MIQMYNQQGITDNYPQYTTNFWGDAGNNYGFGSSNISQNIQKMTDPFNNGNFAGSFAGGTNGTNGFSGNSFASNGSSFSSGNSFGSNANGSDRYSWSSGYSTTPTLQTRTPTPWSSTIAPTYTTQTPWQNNQTLTPWNGGYDLSRVSRTDIQPQRTVYQSLSGFAPDNQRWYENNPQKDSFNYVQDNYETNKLVNDCLKSDRFRQFVSNIKQPGREGHGFHISDQPTNSGISQGLYNQFLQKYPEIAKVYPSKVKDLTQEQVDNIYCQEFYKPNHIETFNDNHTAEHIFDIGVNIGGSEGTKIIQNAYNDIQAQNIGIDGKFGTETVSAINQLQNDALSRLNNQIVNRRYKYYDSLKDKDKYPGWYTRAKSFRY